MHWIYTFLKCKGDKVLIAQVTIFAVVFIGLMLAYFVAKHKNIEISNKFYKILSLVLAVVFFFRFMLGHDEIGNVFALANSPIQSKALTAFSLILNWLLYAVNLLVILHPFFKTSKFSVLIKYFCTVVTLLCVGFFYYITLGIVGENAYTAFDLRTLLLGLELGMVLVYSIVVFLENGKFKVSKHDAIIFAYIPFIMLATTPAYMIQAFFGHINYGIDPKEFALPHRIILYLGVILPFLIYIILKNKKSESIRCILLYISLGTLLTFSLNYRFIDFANVLHWPFHLCNTAMYIIPLCLIFRWEKLFYFTYFINVFGAFLAMLMPNYSDGINLFSTEIVRFYVNHFIAFFMPILIVALRVYKRPKLKQFKYSMVGFAFYFVLVLILNAWFSNYGSVDYFFINSDFIADKLGQWAEDIFKIEFSFKIGDLTFTFYPVYQVLFFIVYVFLGLGVWFVYEGAYTFSDTMEDILARKRKIKLDHLALLSELNGRTLEEPMDLQNKDKLVLKHVTKRYKTSKVYSVYDASLEIEAGDIFGFLGHNGAGKSTIIKSIVGILPITSGEIEVCGYDTQKQPVMAKRNIGYVPDHYALYEKLTGREYINYIADLYGVDKAERVEIINKYVDMFQLNDAFDNQIKTYSHGMKQKIAIMSALVHNPKVWILDEPLTGLDPVSIFQVKECMREHARKGNIVFFSSHLIDIVESLCNKIAIIKRGKILKVADVEEVEKTQTLEEFYLNTSSIEVPYTYVEESVLEKENNKDKKRKKEDKKKNLAKEKNEIEVDLITINKEEKTQKEKDE